MTHAAAGAGASAVAGRSSQRRNRPGVPGGGVLAVAALLVTGDPAGATPFAYRDNDTVVADLEAMAAQYPGLTQLTTAQNEYSLPGDGPAGRYRHFILRVTNEATGLNKPELLIVGTQHGDEVVGVEVALETARLLLERYGSDPWLTQLVDRREIYFVPLANPQGYVEGRRASPGGEGSEDMNRDHVYDRECEVFCEDAQALSTTGARALWELSRRHLFRVMLDFHGGVELIIHPWGTPVHGTDTESPDDLAHSLLGQRLSEYGGPFRGFYPVGTSSDLLGAVIGPLDDSSYAPGWDPANVAAEFPNPAARALSYTVEISSRKRPDEDLLGGDADMLTPGGVEDGYIPKNVRISLAAIDVVDPWIEWSNRNEVPAAVVAGEPFTVRWRARGCFDVDETRVRWSADGDPRVDFDGQTPAQQDQSGTACFQPPRTFTAQVVLDTPGEWFVTPVARVDGALRAQADPNPALPPQSWLVRSRTEDGLLFVNDADPDEVNTVVAQRYRGAAPLRVTVVGSAYRLAAPIPGRAGRVNAFAVTGATPGRRTVLLAGADAGKSEVPGCPGLEADMSAFRTLGSAVATDDGRVELRRFLPVGLAGRSLRLLALEPGTCRLTPLVVEVL